MAEVTPEQIALTFGMLWRKMMYEQTGNGAYAAEAWIMTRKIGIKNLPDWLLEAVDAAAQRGYFSSEVAKGRGKNNDKKSQSADATELHTYIGRAFELWERNPTLSQGKMALELKVDPARFVRILKKWGSIMGPYPWKKPR